MLRTYFVSLSENVTGREISASSERASGPTLSVSAVVYLNMIVEVGSLSRKPVVNDSELPFHGEKMEQSPKFRHPCRGKCKFPNHFIFKCS